MHYLIVVDMQNDFITGALGSRQAVAILPHVREKIETFDGKVIFTRDTHYDNYLNTNEGRNLPVPHCIRDTDGWQIESTLDTARAYAVVDKPTFGSVSLMHLLAREQDAEQITLIGLCTDICVISNAMLLKAAFPEADIAVDAACCAGVTPESHQNALAAMRACQIRIENPA